MDKQELSAYELSKYSSYLNRISYIKNKLRVIKGKMGI